MTKIHITPNIIIYPSILFFSPLPVVKYLNM